VLFAENEDSVNENPTIGIGFDRNFDFILFIRFKHSAVTGDIQLEIAQN
jgi:hypothetical protein